MQLIWQVAGLSLLLYVGFPQSKEGPQRSEAKLDLILRRVDPTNADQYFAELERQFPRK